MCAASAISATRTFTSFLRKARIFTGRARGRSSISRRFCRACPRTCRRNSDPMPRVSAGSFNTRWSPKRATVTISRCCAVRRIGTAPSPAARAGVARSLRWAVRPPISGQCGPDRLAAYGIDSRWSPPCAPQRRRRRWWTTGRSTWCADGVARSPADLEPLARGEPSGAGPCA